MKILALDTATENCSAALWLDGRTLQRQTETDRGHAALILAMVDELLAESGVPLGGLDAIAFGRGPGSFTGVRLAASVTQGLAFGAGLPVVGVSDLRAVAQRLRASHAAADRVIVCNDARMQEVYWGCFETAADGRPALVGNEQVSKPAAVTIPAAWPAPVHGAGRGFAAYPQLRATFGDRLAEVDDRMLPHAAEIALLAEPDVRHGRVATAEEAVPTYLRDDVARPQS